MLLVIDFSDLDLKFTNTDVRINLEDDFTVATLLDKLCEGIEEIGNQSIYERNRLCMLDSKKNKISDNKNIRDLSLSDWDTLFIVKAR